MAADLEAKFAKKRGWHRVGTIETYVKIPLTDQEKIETGAEQSEALLEIRRMEDEKKDFDTAIKGRIQEQETIAHDKALLLRAGYRIERRALPCFLDADAKERVFVDLETGEEMARERMRPEDAQIGIGV